MSNSYNVKIGGVDVTRYAVYPFNFQFTLDDALDQAYIELRNSKRKTAYKPFTEVVITVNDDEPTIYYVGVDNATVNQKTGLTTHKILLTEETKILERVICRAKSFVKPLYTDYLGNSKVMMPSKLSMYENLQAWYEKNSDVYLDYTDQNLSVFNPSTSKSYYKYGPGYENPTKYFSFKSINNVFAKGKVLKLDEICSFNAEEIKAHYGDMAVSAVAFELWSDDYETIKKSNYIIRYIDAVALGLGDAFNIELNEEDSYILRVTVKVGEGPDQSAGYYPSWLVGEWYIGVVNAVAYTDKTIYITDTVNKLLEIAEPIRVNEAPRFTFNAEDAERYKKAPCAEFNFANGASLWENLLEIARTVHCIPRLKNSVVYFDKLGQSEMLQNGVFGTPISHTSDYTSEKFASHLDSVVEGLMNLDDEQQGSISDPFIGGFRTLRSETSVTDMRTTVDTAIIRTVDAIEKITKVTVLYGGAEYDITPYIYEKKEYDLLHSNQGTYPYAKAYGLYYVQDSPNIYGLTYKEANAVSSIFENFAIENILSIVTGLKVDLEGSAWAIGGDSDDFNAENLLKLAFNVTYVNTINGRVRQAKRNVEDIEINSVIAFNQSANKLSSVNFGKRLKGEIAMMGSAETKLVFKTRNWNAIKTAAGKIYPDDTYGKNMYISSVNAKMWRDYFLVELGLTRNFNQFGKFVGINSAVRQFEIDTNVSESYFLDEEYLVFSESEQSYDADCIFNGELLARSVESVLVGDTNTSISKVTLADTITLYESYERIARNILPVQSIALGNSLLFNFKYQDNYSAGEYLQDVDKKYKLTRLARYGDPIYGEAKYLRCHLFQSVGLNGVDKVNLGDSLPLATYADSLSKSEALGNTYREWIVHKSSRDALNVTFQVHFVTDCGIIFGEQLLQGNPLVGGSPVAVPASDNFERGYNSPVINLYKGRVNEMTGATDETPCGYGELEHRVLDNRGECAMWHYTEEDYNSWNIKDNSGRVLLAQNGKFKPFFYYTKRKILK